MNLAHEKNIDLRHEEKADLVVKDNKNGLFEVLKDRRGTRGVETIESLLARIRKSPGILIYWT